MPNSRNLGIPKFTSRNKDTYKARKQLSMGGRGKAYPLSLGPLQSCSGSLVKHPIHPSTMVIEPCGSIKNEIHETMPAAS